MNSQFLRFFYSGKDVQLYVYANKKLETPTEDSFDFLCQLPAEDPEISFCGPEALRDSYRKDFYSGYLEYFLTQRESFDFWKFISNNSQSRCSRALFTAAHPFTCHFSPDQTGRL